MDTSNCWKDEDTIMDIKERLKIEGINFKGYGILPRYVMMDEDLSIESKTIYAYFCSYSGSGNTSLPGRERILRELKISKNYYYKHLNELKEQGYIFIHQERFKNNRFGHNVYTLVSNPKKFQIETDLKKQFVYRKIAFSGLKSLGYGMIPKAVMMDYRLPLKAKGIYAYFCSHSGSGFSQTPRTHEIMKKLNISESSYKRYFSYLVKCNYISVLQQKIDGRFAFNEYILNDNPNSDFEIKKKEKNDKKITKSIFYESFPEGQIKDTQDLPQYQIRDTENSPQCQIRDTAENKQNQPWYQIKDTEESPQCQIREAEIKDTIINDKLFINSFIHLSIDSFSLEKKFRENILIDSFWFRWRAHFIVNALEEVNYVVKVIHNILHHPKDAYRISGISYPYKKLVEKIMFLRACDISAIASIFYEKDFHIVNKENYILWCIVNPMDLEYVQEKSIDFLYKIKDKEQEFQALFQDEKEHQKFFAEDRIGVLHERGN